MKRIIQYIVFIHRYFFPPKNRKSPSGAKHTLKEFGKIDLSDHDSTQTEVETPLPTEEQQNVRPFGEVISDAEHLMSQKLYKEALTLYRALDIQLSGTGELMKIQFVRDRIESLLSRVKGSPGPVSEEIIKQESLTEENQFEATVLEADNYYSHGLYNEALFLYRKLEKQWVGKHNTERIHFIKKKIDEILEHVEDPFSAPVQTSEPSQVAYLDDDGSLLDKIPEEQEGTHSFSPGARAFTIHLLKQRVFLNLLFFLMIIAGIYCLFNSPVENMPSVDMGEVYITTYYYGASAEDVESLITIQIEKAVEGLENVEIIRSRSYRNVSSVGVKFTDDSDYRELYSRLRIRVLNIKNKLPAGCEDSKFLFVDTHWWISVIRVNLFGEASEKSRQKMAEKLKTELNSIDGVRDIEITGETKNEFHISLSPEKLRKNGVTFSETAEAVQSAGTKIPTGNFGTENSEFILDAGNIFSRQEDVLNVIIRRNGYGNFVRVADVVTSAMMSRPDPMNIASINGEDTISLIVRKEDNANAIKIAKKVKEITDEFEIKHQADGLQIAYTNDSTKEINDAVNTLKGNMILGIILVTAILWITLGMRNAIFAAIGIPFSFLSTLIAMKLAGVSINSINLFAFILVSGIIVDDAIIILENIHRHQQMGKSLRNSVIDGVAEIFWPVVSSVLTTVMAFIPLFLISGTTGDFFAVIPMTVAFALTASLLEALVFLPLHIYEWGPKRIPFALSEESSDNEQPQKNYIFDKAWKVYDFALDKFLRNRGKTLVLTFFLFVLAIGIAGLSVSGIVPLIKVKFFPGNYVRYHITVALPASTPIRKTDFVVREVSKFIMSIGPKQAESVSGTAGYYEDEDYSVQGGSQYGQAIVALPGKEIAKFPENPNNDPVQHIDYIRARLAEFLTEKYPDADERPQVRVFPEYFGPPIGKPVNIRISGDNLDRELEVSNRILDYLKNEKETQDLTELSDDRAAKINVVKYLPIQETVYEMGLSPGRITEVIAGALNGVKVGKFRAPSEEVDLKVRVARQMDPGGFSESGLAAPQDILDIPMVEHSSSPIFLRDVVNVQYISEPDSRGRYNGKSTVSLSANIRSGANLTASRVKFLINRYFESISEEFPDITLIFAGEAEASGKTFDSLFVGLIIALLVIYLILAVQFGDYIQPLIILSAVAFAIIGVTFGMFITRSTFTVGSLMAVVGLAGVTVNDSLILIDFMNKRAQEGNTMRQAVLAACHTRMRPVLITTITTIMGLLPMAIGIPYRSLEWAPMATAFVTGLGSATILTLLIIPVEYELAVLAKFKIKEWFQK
ncbi:MAG: efflux RND transporter permease subunit [Proteobacteria bacterium]|nr:efflux RND transporter permease subunit [Pseudomonadota bacterium]